MRHFMLLPLIGACYSYTPLEPARLQPGDDVRLRISAATAEQVAPLIARTDARLLSGLLVTAGADTLIVQVPIANQAAGGPALHQRLAIPRSSIFEVESRSLNRTRTALATGVAAVGIVAILIESRVIGPGKSGPPGTGSPPELRFPLIRVSP